MTARHQDPLGQCIGLEGRAGAALPPVLFEPPWPLVEHPELWIATAGDHAWGGAILFVSEDDDDYRREAGRLSAEMTIGTLLDPIPAAPAHHAHTAVPFRVQWHGCAEMPAATPAQAIARYTDCYIGTQEGYEIVATTATQLVGTVDEDHVYQCSGPLIRGGYGTGRCRDWSLMDHEAGARVVRLDRAVFRFGLEMRHVGQPLWFKLAPQNAYGDAEGNDPAELEPIRVDVQGTFYQRDPRRWLS